MLKCWHAALRECWQVLVLRSWVTACNSGIDGMFEASKVLTRIFALRDQPWMLATAVAQMTSAWVLALRGRCVCNGASDASRRTPRNGDVSVSAAAGIYAMYAAAATRCGIMLRCWQVLRPREQRGAGAAHADSQACTAWAGIAENAAHLILVQIGRFVREDDEEEEDATSPRTLLLRC